MLLCPNLETGGAERHWAMLAPRLAERGWAVRVRTLDGRGRFFDELSAAGVDTALVTPRQLFSEVLRRRPDMVMTRSFSAHGLGAIAATLTRAAWVVNWHRQPEMPMRRHHRRILPLIGRSADLVICVHEVQLPMLAPLRLDRHAIVIPNGTDALPAGETESRALRAEHGVRDDQLLAVMVAALRAEKRHDVFVAAVQRATEQCPQLQAWIVGDGPERDRVAALAVSAPNVELLGRRADVPAILSAADIVCLSSDAEAAPITLLEAMACVKPIIATDVGGNARLLSDERTGLLVPPGDVEAFAAALVRLCRDPQLRAALGRAAQAEQRAQYTADRMAERYASALQTLLATTRKPA